MPFGTETPSLPTWNLPGAGDPASQGRGDHRCDRRRRVLGSPHPSPHPHIRPNTNASINTPGNTPNTNTHTDGTAIATTASGDPRPSIPSPRSPHSPSLSARSRRAIVEEATKRNGYVGGSHFPEGAPFFGRMQLIEGRMLWQGVSL